MQLLFRWIGSWLLVVCFLCPLLGTVPVEPEDLDEDDTALGGASSTVLDSTYGNPRDDQLGDDTLRGCECWKWPECVSNCTVNPILQDQMRTDHLLLARLPQPFVLVFPYQDRKLRSKYGTSTAGKRGTYYMSTKFWIHLPNREHVQLKLQKSRIFGGSNDYSTLYYQRNNEGQLYGFESNKLDHCFYTGTVRHDPNQFEPDTYVAVDTCHGLRGLIQTVNLTYGVLPLRCAQCQRDRLPHVVFPHQPSAIERDARLPVFWQPFDVLATRAHGMKKAGEQQYTVRLTVILDHTLFVAFDHNLEQCIHYIGSVVNLATKSYQGLPIELRLIRSEIWNTEDHIHLNTSIKTTLNNFAVYTTSRVRIDGPKRPFIPTNVTLPQSHRRKHAWLHRRYRRAVAMAPEPASSIIPPVQPLRTNNMELRDVELLLTATQFADVVEYLAVPDSICTPRALAVIQVNTSETLYHVSRLVSLAIAEMLGMKSFPCPPLFSCTSSDLFSEGDKARIRLALVSSMADCLIPTASQEAARFWSDTCGNGQLDRGEECDPSSLLTTGAESSDRSRTTRRNNTNELLPCCNPTTCLADVGSVCTHGACCDRCRLASRGKPCRTARDLCDLPEFCTGTEPTCPADLYLENGSPCHTTRGGQTGYSRRTTINHTELDDGRALCYQGRCPTRDSQCDSIWGSGAARAADYCFMFHNTKTAGACGVLGENCKPQHAMCGLLHCQGGKPRPVSHEAGQPFLTYTEHRGQQFECKHLSHTSKVRFVPEGAACGPNQYCFHQQCVPPNVALRSRCPSGPVNQYAEDGRISVRNLTCSDRGLCTNAGFCLCRPGWSGNACQDVSSTDPLQSLSVSPTRTSSVNRHLLHGSTLLQPDPDIAKRIWMQVEAMQHPDYRPDRNGLISDNSRKSRLNTLYLVVILASVVGGTFLILCVFMLIYRRRGQTGFPRKRSRSRCFFLSRSGRRLDQQSSSYDPKGNGSLRLYETNSDARNFQFPLSPMRSRGSRSAGAEDGFDYHNSSYLSRWSHERRSRRHGKRRGSREPDYTDVNDRHRNHRRRRRKHCRSDRHSGDDLEQIGRSSGRRTKYSDGGLNTSRRLLDSHGANHSDTELACRQAEDLEAETNSMDRIIKFGSMPSYKEDKMKHKKHHGDRNTDVSVESRKKTPDDSNGSRSAPQSPPPTQANGQTVAMVSVATECIPSSMANNDSSAPGTMSIDSMFSLNASPARSPGLSSPLSTTSRATTHTATLVSTAPPPLFPHTTATESLSPLPSGGLVVGSGQVRPNGIQKTTNGSLQSDISQSLGATAALIGAGKAGAAAAVAAATGVKSSLSPIGADSNSREQTHGKPSPNSDALNNTDEMNDVQFSIVMENSWRQPEKGILKNKNEGGGLTSNTTAGSGPKSKSRKSGSDRRHRGHRSSHHRHRHHKSHRSSSHRVCDDMDRDCCSLDSDCSCCLAEEEEKRASRDRSGSMQTEECKRIVSRSRCHHTRHHSLLGSENSLRSNTSFCSARDGNRSASSSGSSRDGLSLSTQSSSSSSFSDLDRANHDAVGEDMLSSSSTSSTCSTALEVGPSGRINRMTSAGENERSSGIQRGDGEVGIERESHRCSSHRSHDGCHRHHHQRRHHNHRRHYGRSHHGRKQHHYGSENAMAAGSSGGLGTNSSNDPGNGAHPESSGSSLSRTTTAGLSGASSSSSGLTPGSTHMHRRHRRVRGRRSTDEDATTSGSHRSSPVPPAPTILCNAGQQTDEISLLKATGLTISMKKEGKTSSSRTEDSEGEWEEVECSESACEECQAASAAVQSASTSTNTTMQNPPRGHSNEPVPPMCAPHLPGPAGFPPPKPFDCTSSSQLVGHTNAAFLPSMRPTGADANMSNTSIAYQQQSTASSSLGSSKNSRIGTPAPIIPNSQGSSFLTGIQSPHGSALGVGNIKAGVSNRAASSSSCSSSSVAGHNQTFPRPMVPPTKSGTEEFPNQHSEPEVDAHLHHIPGARFGAPFYPGMGPGQTGLVLNPMSHANPTGMAMMNPVSTASYNLMSAPSHFLPPPPPPPLPSHPGSGMVPGPQVRREPYPNRFTGQMYTENTPGLNQSARHPTGQLPAGPASMTFPVTSDQNDTYYQHPYEEVATDDYAEATNHSSTGSAYPANHIYHQHGLPLMNNGANGGGLVNGCAYEKGEGDDEERLSLDEGHPGLGLLGPNPLGSRYDPSSTASPPAQLLSNYSHLTAQDPRGGQQSPRWLDPSGLSMNMGKHNAVQPESTNHRDSKFTAGMTDAEDAESEFSLSAFRRDDIRLPSYPLSSATGNSSGSRGLLKPSHLRHLNAQDTRTSMRGSSELGTDVRSNDGTCDESDTSSLPEAGCDLVQLAQLDVSGRPNPLLNDLARQQANSRRWGQHTNSGPNNSNQPIQTPQNVPNYETG